MKKKLTKPKTINHLPSSAVGNLFVVVAEFPDLTSVVWVGVALTKVSKMK